MNRECEMNFQALRGFTIHSFREDLETRVNLMLSAMSGILNLVIGFGILYVIFEKVEHLGGWTFSQSSVVYGMFIMLESATAMCFSPNLARLPEYVKSGELEYMLLRPVSVQLQLSVRHFKVWHIPDFIIGATVVAVGAMFQSNISTGGVFLFFITFAAAICLLYSIWLLLSACAIWVIRADNLTQVFNAFFSAGRFPLSAFPAWMRFVMVTIFPVAFLTTVPAGALLDKIGPEFVGLGLITTIIFAGASQRAITLAIRAYTGAG